jgi:hypothetical protein
MNNYCHFLLLVFLCFSCKSVTTSGKCLESKEFKAVFLKNIQFIDNHFKEFDKDEFFKGVENLEDASKLFEKRKESLMNALKFISQYSHVSFESMWNYGNTYPYGVYLSDRENWIKWYERNKCHNIQLIN